MPAEETPNGQPEQPAGRRRRHHLVKRRSHNPLAAFAGWVEWFEQRGVYVPGEESRTLSAWRDFAWWILAWLISVSVFLVFFALAT